MKPSFLITLYYALASIIGLVLSVVGATMLLNLVFTTIILKIPTYPSQPPVPYGFEDAQSVVKRIETRMGDSFTEEDRTALNSWKASYIQWQEEQGSYNAQQVEKKYQLASAISMLLVGLPVLIVHLRSLRAKRGV